MWDELSDREGFQRNLAGLKVSMTREMEIPVHDLVFVPDSYETFHVSRGMNLEVLGAGSTQIGHVTVAL